MLVILLTARSIWYVIYVIWVYTGIWMLIDSWCTHRYCGTGKGHNLDGDTCSGRRPRRTPHRPCVQSLHAWACSCQQRYYACRVHPLRLPPSPGEDKGDTLPNRASCTSAVVHSIAIIIELIRKNNSDYFKPYLFYGLRNRLIQV
jgi:hypothetical protein